MALLQNNIVYIHASQSVFEEVTLKKLQNLLKNLMEDITMCYENTKKFKKYTSSTVAYPGILFGGRGSTNSVEDKDRG